MIVSASVGGEESIPIKKKKRPGKTFKTDIPTIWWEQKNIATHKLDLEKQFSR